MDQKIKDLIGDVAFKCFQNKINFKLEYLKNVDMDSFPCSGYFDEENLVVATKKKDTMEWVSTLLHESSHLDQFIEKSKLWTSDDDGLNVIEKWLKGKNINQKRLLDCIKNVMALEIDCELRTIRYINKYKLPIDIEKYAQQANAYIFSYVFLCNNRKWFVNPYENTNIVKSMPKSILKYEEYFQTYKNYSKIFDKNFKKS